MRKKVKNKKEIRPDPRYNNTVVAKFINHLMKDGKKTLAQKIFYDAMDILGKEQKGDPMEIFDKAISNVSPSMEVKSKRVGGANYQIPRPVKGERRVTLAMRWIINAAKSRKGKSTARKLAEEFLEASNNSGAAVKKKEDTHRMAEANKAFAHFGW